MTINKNTKAPAVLEVCNRLDVNVEQVAYNFFYDWNIYIWIGTRGDPGLMGPPGRPGEQGMVVSSRRSAEKLSWQNLALFLREILVHLAKLEHLASQVKKPPAVLSFSSLIEFCRH